MARTGDTYTILLNRAMLEWGTHRYTDSRGQVYGEGYLAIPAQYAYDFKLFNGNHTGNVDVLGENIFRCTSTDGFLNCLVKSQGNQSDTEYAKQFSVNDDLKALGNWYHNNHAVPGDSVRVRFISPTDVEFEFIPA